MNDLEILIKSLEQYCSEHRYQCEMYSELAIIRKYIKQFKSELNGNKS